jgi:hypothetical protein
MNAKDPVLPVASSKFSKAQKFFLACAIAASTTAIAAVPSYAVGGTTTDTSPAGILDAMKAGADDMDGIAGLAAALGISSSVFGGGALIFKRFIYG